MRGLEKGIATVADCQISVIAFLDITTEAVFGTGGGNVSDVASRTAAMPSSFSEPA